MSTDHQFAEWKGPLVVPAFPGAQVVENIGYAICNLIDALVLFFLIFSRRGYNGLAWWWSLTVTIKLMKPQVEI